MDTITISKAEYEELKDWARFLDCLQAGGVENWEGYSLALEEYHESEDG